MQTMVTLFLGKENNEFPWNLQILTTKQNQNTRRKNIKNWSTQHIIEIISYIEVTSKLSTLIFQIFTLWHKMH